MGLEKKYSMTSYVVQATEAPRVIPNYACSANIAYRLTSPANSEDIAENLSM